MTYSPQMTAWSAADIRRLRIRASRLVTNLFTGEYRSVFRGRGMEFESVREYQPGDDVRNIDWNVTARSGHPYVKQYIEERELTVMILIDRSASLGGTNPDSGKHRSAVEIGALLALAASRGNDRVGLLAFSDQVEHFLPPAKGASHIQRLIAELTVRGRPHSGTDLAGALEYLLRTQRHGAIVFVISDFLAEGFRLPLAAAAHRYDVVAICLLDPLDADLPDAGLIQVMDAECGTRRLVDSSDARVLAAWRNHAQQRTERLKESLVATGVEHLVVSSREPPLHALSRFFLARQHRLGQ